VNQKTYPGLLWRWLASAASIYVADWLLDGIVVTDGWGAMWVAVLLGVFNIILKPVLMLISLPFIVLTFGIFLLVINAVILLFISDLSNSIEVNGFWTAVLGSIIISLVTYLLNPPMKGGGGNGGGDGGNRNSIYIKIGDREFRG
jgi:putative membrane protein